MKNLIGNKKGFTLVEMIVATLAIGIVLTACYQFFFSAWTLNTAIEDSNEYQNLLDDAMYRIRVEMADAASAVAFDRPADFDESTYAFDEGYVYIISNKYSGYTIYSKDASGNLQKSNVGGFSDSVNTQLNVLENAAAGGNADDVAAYDEALAKQGYRTVIKFTIADDGATEVVVEYRKGLNPLENTENTALTSKIVLRSAVSSGTGNSIKFKTSV
jgi:prepilin-type N-terminal cleavage/methylation domain-containing protein